MSRFDRPLLRVALTGVFIASLGLAACGRKGPLDPPPAASLTGEKTAVTGEKSSSKKTSKDAGFTSSGKLIVPKGKNEPFFLDGLLN